MPNTKSYYIRATEYLGKNEKGKYEEIIYYLNRYLLNIQKYNKCKIDHVNNDSLDNRKCNLRITENKENTKNRKSKNSNNTSGHRNVSQVGKWWYVQMQVDGVNTLLRKFPLDQLEEAGAYAKEMRQKYYKEFKGKS